MRELKCSRMNENNSDVRYYDGYTKFTVPRVRDNQYNPMIVGEREELFNNILDSIDKKQSSPRYDHLFYVEGKNIDVGGGVEYRGMLNHTDDDYTKVNILCELLDKKSGKAIGSFEKDLFLDYSDFMDSYGIESDIEDHILDELKKYMISILAQYDNKYKNENKTMRELKRSSMNESAYNSALNEVRYDIEHEFKPIVLHGDWYIGLDDVKYDYDELSATLFVLNDKDKVVDEETITIPVDAMKDYTTAEIASLKDRMLEKINEVAENLKDSWNVGRGYY